MVVTMLSNKQAYINGQLKVFRLYMLVKKNLKKSHSTAAKEK